MKGLTVAPVTMSSREIAELTGKRHDHVIRDIRGMLDALGDDPVLGNVLEDKDTRGYTACFRLNRELTELLLTGYSVPLRLKVIRRLNELEAGGSRPMTQIEIIAAQAQALVEIERRTMETQQAVAAIEQKVERLEQSSVWDHCPQNCEPITKIRARMLKRYALPAHVVDTVMRGLPLSPKIAGMVRNSHAEAEGQHYAVWAVADVTRVFKRFVSECSHVTPWFATHPDIEGRFKLAPEVEA